MSAPLPTDGPMPYLGEIMMVPYNFAPKGWALCDGQTLKIANNTALFGLIGTTYGGDGVTNFNLPDLRGRVPLHRSPLLPAQHPLGELGGAETVTLTADEMPMHTHGVAARNFVGDAVTPRDGYKAVVFDPNQGRVPKAYHPEADTQFAANMAQATGENRPHTNLQPYMVVNFIIALQGAVPKPKSTPAP